MKKRMKCWSIFVFGFLILIHPFCFASSQEEILSSQQQSLNISQFITEAKEYTKTVFPDMDMNELLNSAIKGKVDNKGIFQNILNLLGKEVKDAVTVLGSILIIIIIHSILKTISDNLENKGVGQITYYVQYILIVTIIMTNFADIITMTKDSIQNLVGFMYTLVPLVMTLMITTGSIATAGLLQPIILFLITFIGNIISTLIIPILLVATALGIVSQISDKIQIDKLAKFFKSSIVWILGIILTIFVGVSSLEGTLSSSVDGVTAKTTKVAVSNFIPVVGKILGDAVETVLGCAGILKNAVGVVGVIIIIGICIVPIIKLSVLTMLYYLAAAICQPIADTKIMKLLEQMGDTFKILLAILCSVAVMLMIGVTIAIKMSNSGMMYR